MPPSLTEDVQAVQSYFEVASRIFVIGSGHERRGDHDPVPKPQAQTESGTVEAGAIPATATPKAQVTFVLSLAAFVLLPVAAAFSWRTSRVVSVALSLATVAAASWLACVMFHVVPWDGLRWLVAWTTGVMGAFELGSNGRPRQLGALLVGSSIADFVSLYRESHGAEFGALPVLQIVVLLAMIWISRRPIG